MNQLHLQVFTVALMLIGTQSALALVDETKNLDRAKQLIDRSKPAAAKVILRDVIRHDPNNAEAHVQLGAALASLSENDNYDDAIAEEQTAIRLDPKSSVARRILGMIFANQKKLDEAIGLLQESCKLNPSSFSAQRDLGSTYLAAGKSDSAVEAWKKALEIKPENISVRLKLASLFSKEKKYSEAISEAAEAVKLNASKPESHLLLGNIKLQSGDAAGSIESFKTAIDLNGSDSFGCRNPLTSADALSGLGWALIHSRPETPDTLVEGILYQRKSIKAFPHFLPAHIRLAELLEKQHKLKDAEALYQRLFAATQANPAVGLPYARFLVNTKQSDAARAVLKRVLEKWPDNKDAADMLSSLAKV